MIYTPPTEPADDTIRIDDQDPTQVFMWQELPTIRAVAADLLKLVLDDESGSTALA